MIHQSCAAALAGHPAARLEALAEMKAETLLRLGRLFNTQGWPLSDPTCQFPDLFEKFAKMCDRLKEPELELVLVIAQEYRWFRDPYWPALYKPWVRLVAQLGGSTNLVVVAPLIAPGSPRPKSGDTVFNVAKQYEQPLAKALRGRQLQLVKAPGSILPAASTTVVLVDDYVGSGSTVLKAVRRLKSPPSPTTPVYVLAIAAQAEAIHALAQSWIIVVANVVLERGISDHPSFRAAPQDPLLMMDRLGARMNIAGKHRRGYFGTEALATLMRTPNNTFPVFWTNRKVKGAVWDPPFLRITKYSQ